MLLAAPSKRGPCLSVLPKHRAAIARRQEPQQHVRKQDPHRVLHPLDSLISLRILGDIHLPKDAKCDEVAEEHKRIDKEEEPRLYEREHEDERDEGTESTADHAPDPLRVDVHAGLACAVKVDGVQTDHGKSEDELEEAQDDADECANGEVGPERGAGGGFFAAQGAPGEEVEGHDEDLKVFVAIKV